MFGDGAFHDAGADADTPWWQWVRQYGPADGADEVDGGFGDDAGGVDDLVAGGVQGDGEAGPSGLVSGAVPVASAMARRTAW